MSDQLTNDRLWTLARNEFVKTAQAHAEAIERATLATVVALSTEILRLPTMGELRGTLRGTLGTKDMALLQSASEDEVDALIFRLLTLGLLYRAPNSKLNVTPAGRGMLDKMLVASGDCFRCGKCNELVPHEEKAFGPDGVELTHDGTRGGCHICLGCAP